MRTFKLITRFYSGFFLVNFLVTLSLVCAAALHRDVAGKLVGLFFWCKIISIAIVAYAAISYRKKELYYYQNLGVTKWQLVVFTSITDFLIWLALMVAALTL